MAHFALIAFAVAIVSMTGFGVVAYTLGRASGLWHPEPDGYVARRLPPEWAAGGENAVLTFPTVLLGYDKHAVDAMVNRLGTELTAAALRIGEAQAPAERSPRIRGSAAQRSGDTEELR
ncbi:MAG TPA: hypothetical protein VHU91_02995 [Mycobacteriales bacterium]|jgi:hypothetical protein|nr:hypothetical protein [Mycobacteriales bacterium]